MGLDANILNYTLSQKYSEYQHKNRAWYGQSVCNTILYMYVRLIFGTVYKILTNNALNLD